MFNELENLNLLDAVSVCHAAMDIWCGGRGVAAMLPGRLRRIAVDFAQKYPEEHGAALEAYILSRQGEALEIYARREAAKAAAAPSRRIHRFFIKVFQPKTKEKGSRFVGARSAR